MVDLPEGNEGLAWISYRMPSKMLLIPGLPANIVSSAAGDDTVLAILQLAAQFHAGQNSELRKSHSDSIFDSVYILFSREHERPNMFKTRLARDSGLRDIVEARKQHSKSVLGSAVAEGNLAALKWMLAISLSDDPNPSELLSIAACSGQLHIMQYLCSPACRATLDVQLTLGARQHVECLKWLLCCDPPCELHPGVIPHFISVGDLDMLAWLQNHFSAPAAAVSHWTTSATTAAAEFRRLDILEQLRNQDPPCPWDEGCMLAAVKNKDIAMLKWLRSQDPPCPWDVRCSAAAVNRLSLRVLQQLHTPVQPLPWDQSCAAKAVSRGTSMVQWLRSLDPACPWDNFSTTAAARRKGPDVLKWLCEEGCPLDVGSACVAAAASDSQETLLWLHAYCRTKGLQMSFLPRMFALEATSASMLMLLGDLRDPECHMNQRSSERLDLVRNTFCTFHGLLRWWRNTAPNPSRWRARAFDNYHAGGRGQELLVHLNQLPPDLLNKVASMAGLPTKLVKQSDAATNN